MGAETLIHARTATGGDIRVVVPRSQRVQDRRGAASRPDPGQTHVFDERRKGGARHERAVLSGMTPAAARCRLEDFIIGLGVLALVLIFQPFTIAPVRGRLRPGRAGGARSTTCCRWPSPASRCARVVTVALVVAHDLLHRAAGFDHRGASLRRVLPQAAGSQHSRRQGAARHAAFLQAGFRVGNRRRGGDSRAGRHRSQQDSAMISS